MPSMQKNVKNATGSVRKLRELIVALRENGAALRAYSRVLEVTVRDARRDLKLRRMV